MKKIKFRIGVWIFFMFAILAGGIFSPANFVNVYAEENTYSAVLDDLKRDSSFKSSDYPVNNSDYSLQVIQIAESVNGGLFVYVYQPCTTKDLRATDINMSLEDSPNNTKLYELSLISVQGVFCKYKVRDFTVSDKSTRYYNITSIYREWIKGIDAETGNDNTKNEVAFEVGKCYKATTKNGEISYSCEKRKTVKILNPYADFLRYTDGFFLTTTACDSHYVAFNTDMKIDELYEADLSYQSRSVHYYHAFMQGGKTDYGEWQNEYAFLTDEQEFIKDRTGWLWGSEKKYNRIQRVADFISSEKLTHETKENLKGKKWVLRFAETDCKFMFDGSDQGNNYWSEVSNVTILRLKFKSAETVYNLGAVSDKVTGDSKPGNVVEGFDFWQYVWNCIVKLFAGKANFVEAAVAIIAILVVLVLLPLAVFVLSIVFPAFGAVVKLILKGLWTLLIWLFKGLWWLVCLPFKGIAALVEKIKDKKDGGQ